MKVALGADHGGYKLKAALVDFLKQNGYIVKDFGTDSPEPCDYPVIGQELSKAVSEKKYERGILICKTGIGMSIVANKFKGVRAALCDRLDIAVSSREHNGSNVLVFAANIVSEKEAKKIALAWLSAKSPEGRHKRRVDQIKKIDKTILK